MPLLFPNLPIHQVFGANTEVGKTLLTTALVRATASRYAANSGSSAKEKRVFYLKPVSTGPDEESDVSYILRNTKPYSSVISAHNLYQYREPMSPHLAAQLAPDLPFPKSNDELVRGIEGYAASCVQHLAGREGSLFVETAGGVHSPALHPPHTQSTFLRSLRLPSILIAAPQLGGISTTISAYESLLMRGYSISAVLCLYHPYYRNHTFLQDYFREQNINFWTVKAPPEKYGTVAEDGKRLESWYIEVEGSAPEEEAGGGGVGDAAIWLRTQHKSRIEELEGMPQRTLDRVWWPFTQHGLVNNKEDIMIVDSAFGDNFDAHYLKPPATDTSNEPAHTIQGESLLKSYFDGSASWFTQSHGHANEALTLAAASAAGRYGHVLFPSGTNQPALELAEKLVSTVGKGWAERAFFSDNGSTGMEVALKMALRASGRRYGWDGELGGDVGVIGLRGGYHGDTIGAMDATQASTFNKAVDWYKGRGHWFSPPMVQFVKGKPTVLTTGPDQWPTLPSRLQEKSSATPEGWSLPFTSFEAVYDLSTRSSSDLAQYYRQHIRSTLERLTAEGRQYGALVMEPTCLGAGGMVFVDPLFQACLIEVVRSSGDLFGGKAWNGGTYEEELGQLANRDGSEWRGLPVIYDEVFSGLHRFGYNTASSVLHHTPDISAYAKILTGGLLPLSATVASSSIFSAFLSDKKVDALLHGHSYTANPIGCAVALKAVQLVEDYEKRGGWRDEKAAWGVATSEEGEGRWSFWSQAFVEDVSRVQGVKGAMAMGTVFAVELEDAEGGYSSHKALDFLTDLRKKVISPPTPALPTQHQNRPETGHGAASGSGEFAPFQIHSRPLGNVVYLITSLWTKSDVMRGMERTILGKLKDLSSS